MKICFCATHHAQYNGYSKVAFEICKRLANIKDVELTYFGFQNFNPFSAKHKRELPKNVVIYDAAANEIPKQKGFGIDNAQAYFTDNKFDVVLIYNDMIVINAFLEQIQKIGNRTFKVIAYIDQVYMYQKKHFIDKVNDICDAAIAFTPEWKDSLIEQGITIPITDLRHGVDQGEYYPVPKNLARKYFGLNEKDFIVMNLNRNQPRKRWDICLKAFAEVISRLYKEDRIDTSRNVKLLIATSLNGAWNLIEIFERELKKRGIPLSEGQKHLIVIDAPQMLPDFDVNVLMNCADIGINTCDGEGFGLCQFEQASIGIPQIVPRLGGFKDFFDDTSAIFCDPVLNYYIDTCRDGVGGEAQICEYSDFSEAMLQFYNNPEMISRYGASARNRITKSGYYNWGSISLKLHGFMIDTCYPKHMQAEAATSNDDSENVVQKIDVNQVQMSDAPASIDAKPVAKTCISENVNEEENNVDKIDTKPNVDIQEIKRQLNILNDMIKNFETK